MARIYLDNSRAIGETPLVRLNRVIPKGGARVLAKIEGRNPAYSVKCRIGASMVWDAEQRGVLKKGMEIVEPTSGNTGIALAYVAAARGYDLTLTMPETMSLERRKVLAVFGAKLVLTDGSRGMASSIEEAERISVSDPEHYFFPQQFKNPANPYIHQRTTGPEIWQDTDGKVDALVCGVGTGGTLTGISRYAKEELKTPLISVAVEPETSPVITQKVMGQPIEPGEHGIQGIGAGFIPDTLDIDLIDRVEKVSDEESMEMGRRLAREEGIIAGISSGAAAAVAVRLAGEPEFEGKTIVVVLPDGGERYLSTGLFNI